MLPSNFTKIKPVRRCETNSYKYLGHIEKIENGLGFFFREEYIANAMHMAVNLAHKYIYHKNIQDFSNTLKSAVNQYAVSV